MPIKTSKNMTIVGIASLVIAILTFVVIPIFDGDPNTNINLTGLFASCVAAVALIMGKGEQSTGGTVIEGPVGSKKAIEAAAAKKD